MRARRGGSRRELEGKMKDLLLTYRGRINRAKIWMALLYYIGIGVAVGVLFMILAQLLPGDVEIGRAHV